MKKTILLLFLSLFLSNNSNAQFTVNKLDGTPLVNNQIVEFTTSNSTAAELKFFVANTSSENLDFRIRCMDLVNNTGANFQLCWAGSCLPDVNINGVYPSDFQFIINSGQNTNGLNDNFKNFNPGDGVNYPMDYKFRFFTKDLAGAVVGSNFNITYRYQGPLSIDQKDKLNLMGVKVINTLVQEFIGLEIQKNVNYQLVNLQGQRISGGLLSSNINLDLSNVPSGMYLLNFSNEEGIYDTVKIVKK